MGWGSPVPRTPYTWPWGEWNSRTLSPQLGQPVTYIPTVTFDPAIDRPLPVLLTEPVVSFTITDVAPAVTVTDVTPSTEP